MMWDDEYLSPAERAAQRRDDEEVPDDDEYARSMWDPNEGWIDV